MTPLPPSMFADRLVRLAIRLASRYPGARFPAYPRMHRGLRLFSFWWQQAIRRSALAQSLSGGSVT